MKQSAAAADIAPSGAADDVASQTETWPSAAARAAAWGRGVEQARICSCKQSEASAHAIQFSTHQTTRVCIALQIDEVEAVVRGPGIPSWLTGTLVMNGQCLCELNFSSSSSSTASLAPLAGRAKNTTHCLHCPHHKQPTNAGGGDYTHMRHMFDGFGLVSKLRVQGGRAWGSQRYVNSKAYQAYTAQGVRCLGLCVHCSQES